MTRPIHFLIMSLLFMGSYTASKAQCSGVCSKSAVVSADSFSYTLNSGRLQVPAGIDYEGDIYISEGAVLENHGTISGRIFLEGGELANNGTLKPSEICLKKGRFSNYGSLVYSRDICTGNGLLIENYGEVTLEKDFVLQNSKLVLFGSFTVRDLIVMPGSQVELYGHSVLKLNDLDVYDSVVVVNPTARIDSRNVRVRKSGFIEANGAVILGHEMKVDGKVLVNDDMHIGKILSIDDEATFSVSANTQAWVGERIANNSAYFMISGTVRVEGELDNVVTASLLDEGKIYVKALQNYGTISGNGDGHRSLKVAETAVNKGRLLGSFDFCDSSVSASDINTGSIASSVSMCSNAVLSSKLISFTAENNNTFVTLRWTTAREENSSHFEVEIMENENSWITAARIQGQGSSIAQQDYVFNTILESNPSVAYFRLRQVDLDGKFEYSPILKVSFDVVRPADAMIVSRMFAERIEISYKSGADGKVNAALLDSRGLIVKKFSFDVKEGSNAMNFPAEKLGNGVYFLKLEHSNGSSEVVKVLR